MYMTIIERKCDKLFIDSEYEKFIKLPYAERNNDGVVIDLTRGKNYTYKIMGEPSKLYGINKLEGTHEVKYIAKNTSNGKSYYIFYLEP